MLSMDDARKWGQPAFMTLSKEKRSLACFIVLHRDTFALKRDQKRGENSCRVISDLCNDLHEDVAMQRKIDTADAFRSVR